MAISPPPGLVRFGLFQLDAKTRQLSRNGVRIRLPLQPMQVLCELLERPGEIVTREELRKLLWPPDVFVDFDQGLNKSIQKLREALVDPPQSPRYIETIPRTGYRFIAPVIRETASQQWTPSAEPVPPAEIAAAGFRLPRKSSRRGLWLALAGCAVTALAACGWIAVQRGHAAAEPIRSLAVLPLDNLSGDPGQDYLADGMTDELTTMLARNSTLRIVSRTSAMQYKGAHRPVSDIARALGVDGILEGSMSRSNKQVHMTLQLIRADTDAHIWAESYDRDASDIVALPRNAAEAIAKRLKSAASQAAPRYVNPEAHDAYIHGRYLWNAGQNEKAGEYFRRATELQPDYSLGWSGMSRYYGTGAAEGYLNPAESLPLAEAAAIKAVQLDDSSSEAHLELGGSIFMSRWDWTRAERESDRAIELDPEYGEAYLLRARILAALSRNQDAIDAQKKATELNPSDWPWALPLYYVRARQYEAALKDALQRLEVTPNDVGLNFDLFEIYRLEGMDREAVQYFERGQLLAGDKDAAEGTGRAFQRGGYKAVVALQIAALEKQSASHYVSPVDLAGWYAQLGKREKTLSLLEEGYRQHSPLLLYMQCDPEYDFLHADPRYRSLIRRIGLPPAW